MRLNEIVFTDAKPVEGYGPGFFRIGGKVIHGAMLAGPDGTQTWGGLKDSAPLLALAGKVDVLFVGTGADVAHLPENLRTALEDAGLGVEPMSSPAACRTYNILLSEGRRIALALLPV
jgi:uncharacterized protein